MRLRGAWLSVVTLLGAGVAHAAPLRVSAVQWVQGRPEIPHPAVNGKPTMLQAVAEGGNCGGNYRYRWDVDGDGDFDNPTEAWRNASSGGRYAGFFAPLGLDVQYPNVPGDTLFFPKVQVTCGDETAQATMPVLVRVNRLCPGYPANHRCEGDQNLSLTRRWHADRVVDRALWYMFVRFGHRADDGYGHRVHTCWYDTASPRLYGTGHALNAFLRRGHGHGEGRDGDVYYRHLTQCGVHAMLTTMSMRGGLHFTDTDRAGIRGQAIQHTNGLLGGASRIYSYESTAWVEPIANFGDPDYVAPAGTNGIFGRPLREIGQDLADGLVQCQASDGGWFYTCQNGRGGTSDASTNGWAPEALRLLKRKFGTETYAWARDRQRSWLGRYCANGNCVYHHGGPKLSGNALVGYGWTEDERYDPNNRAVRAHVESVQRLDHYHWGLYYMYASTKGLRSFNPEIKYLPNGRDWASEFTDFLVARQFGDGHWDWAGNWAWRGSVNNDTRTAMITQIVQSWLETQAFARATPELAGPGIDITFDHSWSYVIDPSVSIEEYRWNVIDYPRGHDANGDGDFEDEGDHPPEDRNGNGRVDLEEIVWDFRTDDPDETFVYAYEADLGWDDVQNHTVTLAVVDSAGRVVHDQDSVRIQLSLRNHVPVIVAHPDGLNARYRGYIGTDVLLDGRRSYDVDSEHEVFPGDDERPRGIPDRVTSIHFDLNLDGDFDDPGEDGTNGPVRLRLREGMAEGDLLSIPMRVCDDGQWNGKCYDGVTRADCSECAFGSAPVELVPNVRPPAIDVGPDPYQANLRDPVQLDLSGTRDPEGVLGIRYTYEVIEGRGRLVEAEEFRDVDDDMGPNPQYIPEPDGPRVDRIRVRAWDFGGLQSEAVVRVQVPNLPPAIEAWDVAFEGRSPQVGAMRVQNLGNGRYRATVEARPSPDWDAFVDWRASDPGGDRLNAEADLNGDGEADVRGAQGAGPMGPFALRGGQRYGALLRVADDADAVTSERALDVPPADPTLRYFFDLGADGSFEVAGSGQGHFEFEVEPGVRQVVIAGHVRGIGGAPAPFRQAVELGNEPPVFELAEVLDQDGFRVVVTASAFDPDGDDVTYLIDWGDGSEPTRSLGGMAAHAYPDGAFRQYTIAVTADDGRGGRTVRRLAVEFEAPPENRAPVIEELQIIRQGDWGASVVVGAADADGDALTYRFDWGDGAEPTVNAGGVAAHSYPEGAFRAYTITVTVTDGRGGRAERRGQVDFPEPAANRPPAIETVRVLPQGDWEILVVASAVDPDGDALTYRFDWGDGSDPTANRGGIASHGYPEDVFRAYDLTVVVEDGRGGSDEQRERVDFPEPEENRPPVVDEVAVDLGPRGRASLAVEAFDPEGSRLTYRVHWGDEEDPDATAPLLGGSGSHRYELPADGAPYQAFVVVTDAHGNRTREAFEIRVRDNPTLVRDFSANVIRDGTVLFNVVAEDEDGDDFLVYSFDFTDDGQLEVEGQADPSIIHNYAEAGDYTARVRVTDTWSGASVEETLRLRLQPWVGENGAPVIGQVRVDPGPRGEVSLTVDAWDPEGGRLTYAVHWGDEEDPDAREPLVAGIGEHVYAFPIDGAPYRGWVAVTDDAGSTARAEFEAAIADHPTEIRHVAASLVREGTFLFTVLADDPDGSDQLTYAFDFDGDGTWELADQASPSAVHTYAEPGVHTVRTAVTDTWSGVTTEAETRVELEAWRPDNRPPAIHGVAVEAGPRGQVTLVVDAADPDGDRVDLVVHWGDEADADAVSALAGDGGSHAYAFPAGGAPYAAFVRATDPQGASVRRDFEVAIADRPTVIDRIGAVLVREGTYLFTVEADDGDGADGLTYAFDFDGDGTDEVEETRNPSTVHTYAGPGVYVAGVTVTDTWSGAVTRGQVELEVRPWVEENGAPVIHGLQVTPGPRGRATLVVDAADPDGDRLDVVVHWGDEADPEDLAPVAGFRAEHTYPFPDDGAPYAGYVRVTDPQGASVREDFAVEIADRPTVIREVDAEVLREGTYLVTILADDPDGTDQLVYHFDFDDDGTWDVADRAANSAVHAYGDAARHRVRIGVRDTWSGATVEGAVEVGGDEEVPTNRPPVIHGVDVSTGPGGLASIVVDALDPEGGRLAIAVHWGDEEAEDAYEALPAADGTHVYAYRGDDVPYAGRVRVTDPRGAAAEASFEVPVADTKTTIRGISASPIRDGRVLLSVQASDADSAELLYAFDADGDGTFDVAEQPEPTALHTYTEAGAYEVVVAVTDPWSGVVTEGRHRFELAPWVDDVPIADDHLEGEEGRCMVFRIGVEGLSTKVDPAVCDRERNPDPDAWRWDFGDGATAAGSEVGHRYADDGIYEVRIEGGPAERPRQSTIQVYIANGAPVFLTQPTALTTSGERYTYRIALEDPGATDAIRLELVDGPEGMDLAKGETDREWVLSWDVPLDYAGARLPVALQAEDGHFVDGAWVPDDGTATQRFELIVGGELDDGKDPLLPDAGADGGAPSGFDAYTGSSCQCGVTGGGPGGVFLLVGLLGLARARRRRR